LHQRNDYFAGNGLEQFRVVRELIGFYDEHMNFSFLSPLFGYCTVRLWASGRYGFVLPKKVEITRPTGEVATFVYHNRNAARKYELGNRALVRIAIAQFLGGAHDTAVRDIDDAAAPWLGALTQIRSLLPPPAPLRVRPGARYGRKAQT
jgi:hypothetical protein